MRTRRRPGCGATTWWRCWRWPPSVWCGRCAGEANRRSWNSRQASCKEGTINRRNQILTGILGLQLLLGLVVLWPPSTASGGEGASLFRGVEADGLVALTLADAGGERLQLAKNDGQWVLPEADDYPCLEDKVPLLLDKLVQSHIPPGTLLRSLQNQSAIKAIRMADAPKETT